ncbi:hypothetical protein E4T43_00215 [Aureobasidium subglaciale]|nr:hypothetical protein E4T43_00215 [Aureobasidium subglaciale]
MNLCLVFLLLFLHMARGLPLNSPLLSSYDYIIVGGGPSGLTVANRLSEDPTVNVLLLEAGPADNNQAWIQIPFFAGQGVGSSLDWNILTAPQTYLDGRTRALPQGRVLGGGTNRGGIGDYDDWVALGNPGWSFWELLPYFGKSETFTPHPQSEAANAVGINQNPLVHGSKGPVNVSFSNHIYNETVNFFSALNELKMPVSFDPNDGLIAGASFLPLSLNPAAQTRCDARSAYLEPYIMRPNLWVSTNQHATRILFEGGSGNPNTTTPTPDDSNIGQGSSFSRPDGLFSNITQNGIASLHRRSWSWILLVETFKAHLSPRKREPTNTPVTSVGKPVRANGVEFSSAADVPRKNVTATREIIIAAGALHTPQLLKLSGLGPSDELQPLQIPVLVDLPGVGMNLQDHALVGKPTSLTSVQIANNHTLMSQFGAMYQANRTGPWTAGPPDGNAFPALSFLSNRSLSIITKAQTQKASDFLPSDVHQTVLTGFDAQRGLLVNALQDPKRAVYELLNFNYGAFSNVNMRPFSRGTVKLKSSRPFDPPIIDPRYGSNPVDLDVLLASIVYNRQVLGTTSMKLLEPLQVNPRLNATDQEIMDFIKGNIQTEFHPSGTCAMLPLDLGGVVDPDLLVYGTQNLRIVDASIMPLIPASHLQAVVYGIAEKVRTAMRPVMQELTIRQAADIIKNATSGVSPKRQPSPSSSTQGTNPVITCVSETASSLIFCAITGIDFADIANHSFAVVHVVLGTAFNIFSDPVVTNCSCCVSSDSNVIGSLFTPIDIHLYVYIDLHVCLCLHMRRDPRTRLVETGELDTFNIDVDQPGVVIFYPHSEHGRERMPASFDIVLPASENIGGIPTLNDASFPGPSSYIRTYIIHSIKYNSSAVHPIIPCSVVIHCLFYHFGTVVEFCPLRNFIWEAFLELFSKACIKLFLEALVVDVQ